MAREDRGLPGYGGLITFKSEYSKIKLTPSQVVYFVILIIVIAALMHLFL